MAAPAVMAVGYTTRFHLELLRYVSDDSRNDKAYLVSNSRTMDESAACHPWFFEALTQPR